MLKLINDVTGTYRLTIEYREKEYSFIARCISRHIGEELWFIWAAKNRLLRVIYNTATQKLKEDLMHGQPASIPEEFLKVLEKEFNRTRNETGRLNRGYQS